MPASETPLSSNPRTFFKYLIGAAALFIAGCSAFFSVQGLGLLFIGSAVAVMVMAASLEVGKLVTASFLYRFWGRLSRPLRFYLTAAVLLLIAITSLGNYGYLARAYEQTQSQIGLLEQQITSVQKEIDDTQKQIDGSKTRVGQTASTGREDIQALQSRIDQANQSFEQSLKRTDAHSQEAQANRNSDVETHKTHLQELAGVLSKGLESDRAIIDGLNERLAVLDRAVDAYTAQGGPAFLKSDGIRKGQRLREEQQAERTDIAAQIAAHQESQAKLRRENATAVEGVNRELAGVEERYRKEVDALSAEEKSLRQTHALAIADLEKQLAALQSQGQATASSGTNEIEAMYQRIRSGNEQIRHLREQIAATDIGSYRFVARAFNAPADDVVKWLILVLVLVFDPLAVALTVGFNVALVSDRRASAHAIEEPQASTLSASSPEASSRAGLRWLRPALTAFAGIALLAGVLGAGWYGWKTFGQQDRSTHSRIIPADSFAVLTLRPAELDQSAWRQAIASRLETWIGASVVNELQAALQSGFDPRADVYLFLKYPTAAAADAPSDRPAVLCGLVARVADPAAAELSLSRLTDALSRKFGVAASANVARARSMVKFGRGRYLDPRGTFLTFGLSDREAIILLELEGDPNRPSIENEIRLCLANPKTGGESYGKAAAALPQRALSGQGPATLWFNASQCFARMPRNPAAQARYQQLQRHLAFDLLLTLGSRGGDSLNLVADYRYDADRFRAGAGKEDLSAIELLAKLGPSDQAGLAGQLMDRCASTLDFDSLIERLKTSLGRPEAGAAEVLVEKSIASDREARFTLTAQFDPATPTQPVAALNSQK